MTTDKFSVIRSEPLSPLTIVSTSTSTSIFTLLLSPLVGFSVVSGPVVVGLSLVGDVVSVAGVDVSGVVAGGLVAGGSDDERSGWYVTTAGPTT